MNAKAIAQSAAELVGGDRKEAYGDVMSGLGRIAVMWNGLLTIAGKAPQQPINEHDVAQMMVGYAGSRPDSWGITGFGLSVFASPGGLGDGNTTAAFETIRAGAHARYAYARADVSRVTTLPQGLSWVVRLQGQRVWKMTFRTRACASAPEVAPSTGAR